MNKTKGKHFTAIAAMRGMTIIAILSIIGFGFIGCKDEPIEGAYVEQDGFRFYPIAGGKAYSVAGLPTDKNDASIISFDIPAKINKKPVTAIRENAFNGFSYLEEIIIPESITTIGNYALKDCKRLKNITIPDSVESMGIHVFSGCSELETVRIGDSVTSIGNESFYECVRLRDIIIGSSVTAIGDRAFYRCTDLVNIIIPGSVTTIGVNAFDSCIRLEDIEISEGVTTIGYSAFHMCTSMGSITIPGSVTNMGSNVFNNCISLHTIKVPFVEDNKPFGWHDSWLGLTDGHIADILYSTGYTAAADNSTDTTAINLTFSSTVAGLTANDITITNGTGVVEKGELSGSGTSWSIAVTVTTTGNVTVSISKTGIESESKTVAVATSSAPPIPDIIYVAAADNGTDTTAINLIFSADVTLTETDITITDGSGVVVVTPGALTGSGLLWSIPITVTTAGDVTVSITKAGIESGNKTVTVAKSGG